MELNFEFTSVTSLAEQTAPFWIGTLTCGRPTVDRKRVIDLENMTNKTKVMTSLKRVID